MATFVPLLSRDQVGQLPGRAGEVVEYRKSGLSLNHVRWPPACTCCPTAITSAVRSQRAVRTCFPRPARYDQPPPWAPGEGCGLIFLADRALVSRTVIHEAMYPRSPAGRRLRPPTPSGRPGPHPAPGRRRSNRLYRRFDGEDRHVSVRLDLVRVLASKQEWGPPRDVEQVIAVLRAPAAEHGCDGDRTAGEGARGWSQ